MSKNAQDQMKTYSDERITNIIKQQNFFGAESVAIAKEVALKRGLLTAGEIEQTTEAVAAAVAERKSTPFVPKSAEAPIAIGSVLFLIYFIIKWAIKIAVIT